MAVKASAHSEAAAWRAVQHQLSAVSGRILLADAVADDKQKVSTMNAEAIG